MWLNLDLERPQCLLKLFNLCLNVFWPLLSLCSNYNYIRNQVLCNCP